MTLFFNQYLQVAVSDLPFNSLPSLYRMLKALWRAFVDDLVDNDEKVASSKKTDPNAILECKKTYSTLVMTKMAKIDTLHVFMTKMAEKPYPLGPRIPIFSI